MLFASSSYFDFEYLVSNRIQSLPVENILDTECCTRLIKLCRDLPNFKLSTAFTQLLRQYTCERTKPRVNILFKCAHNAANAARYLPRVLITAQLSRLHQMPTTRMRPQVCRRAYNTAGHGMCSRNTKYTKHMA